MTTPTTTLRHIALDLALCPSALFAFCIDFTAATMAIGWWLHDERKMDNERYRAVLERLGMTQTRAAEFLSINPRTSRRFATGECVVPAPIAMLLEITVKYDIDPKRARKLAGLPPLEGPQKAK